ncbi:redox-sensitive transcriptional activator SoxR [Acinetobacter cumulans]|jgi:MerR family redox-sensitive transcriptional activator SoxR|uniref:Redox-sensitive transcriptional activator SoxR n=1 Tax=Acinetobacter cumulans TaxID=2136182 RepID=A0A498DET2_9GAMM|nr:MULTISPECIES: redox-sensitive transcriptional activator SoxR [Acinetobacter]NWK75010.1 redox-sensitive transcriptional activator SoxR [Acinetobacter sp. SwsAc6]QCO20261.1 redox-sensitive transcriptional activator SoxR [Acinetobacter cumulans]RLL37297.1 redox-sensitive transcriptional activator SoxR [Acinetobacter cumulans]RLL46046.1 redox-sensitive transcriptional activator SoxR [Acinetobacter cumulans]
MQESKQQWLSIGQLAERSGVSVPTVRFYEEKQLIWSTRTTGNQRRYQRAMLRRIAIIKIAQQVGISLQQVYEAFEVLPKHQVASKADWQQMSQRWQQQLDAQIMYLLQLRQQLDSCIGCGCLSLQQCPLRNPDDQLSQQSAGAHFQHILMHLERFTESGIDHDSTS